jgi:hypothetical protein
MYKNPTVLQASATLAEIARRAAALPAANPEMSITGISFVLIAGA